MSRGRCFGLVGSCLAVALLVSACTGGGGGGASRSGSTVPGAQPQGGSYVNPAWNDPTPAPAVLWAQDQVPSTDMADWFFRNPFLLDRSLWASHVRASHVPGREDLGAYGIGNGRVFTMVGLSYPLNTLHGTMGPAYQIGSNGFFGDITTGLIVQPWQVSFTEEWAWKVRRQAIVITKSDAANVAMWTVDFAPPGIDAICRVVIVKNKSSQVLPDATVVTRVQGGTSVQGNRLTQVRGDRKLTVGAVPGTPMVPAPGAGSDVVSVQMGSIPPGEERTALVYMVLSRGGAGEQATINAVETASVDALLNATRAHWDAFFAEGAAISFPDQKVQDWIDDMLITAGVQTAENGNVTPMSRYTKTWMRDTEGPLRLFLKTGRHARVERMLDAFYKTSILAGGIFNSMPVDMDTSLALAPINWLAGQFMPGRNATEAPSYIVLNAWEYFRNTGDLTLLREQYDYFKASVLRQERSPDNLMKFNGDEPFRWVLAAALGLFEPENLGWSSNSAFLFVAAADRLAAIAGALGHANDQKAFFDLATQVRDATEKNFFHPTEGFYDVCKLFHGNINMWKPFEDISLMPLRIGYGSPRDPNMRSNLLYVMRTIGQADGSVVSPFLTGGLHNGLRGQDGMVPGYYLTNLTLIDHPEAEKTFNFLEKWALPSGEIAEGQYVTGNYGAIMIQYSPIGGPDVVARYRPWEGAICADAALDYLLGTQPDALSGKLSITPHLPNGWGGFTARGLQFLGERYDLEVKDLGWRRLTRVTNRGSKDLTVDVGISTTALQYGQLRVDGQLAPIVALDAEFGRIAFRVERTLAPGQWVDIDVEYVR